MQKVIQTIKQNKRFASIGIVTFVIAWVFNTLSPYTADDYSYMFSSVTGERIRNIFQILLSLGDNYLNLNGRVLPHFFLQMFLLGPKWIFNIANAAMYVWIIWMMQKVNSKKKDVDILLWIATAVGVWVYLPAYGQVFLWMTGSINYSWAFAFSLAYIWFYIKLLQEPKKVPSKKNLILFCVYGFLFGAYSAQLSFATVFVSFLILCVTAVLEKEIKKYLPYVLPVVASAAGYLTMILSPAETERLPQMTLGMLFSRTLGIFETYYSGMKILLAVWAVLVVLAVCFEVDKRDIVVSAAFVLISLISMAMLFAASYIVGRHYANADFFVLAAIEVLMQSLIEKGKIRCVPYSICAYLLAVNIWTLWTGTYDIYDTYAKQKARDAYVQEQIAQGNTGILYVEKIYPQTKYSCKYDLADLQINDDEVWPNYAVAAYYGIDDIYGIE